ARASERKAADERAETDGRGVADRSVAFGAQLVIDLPDDVAPAAAVPGARRRLTHRHAGRGRTVSRAAAAAPSADPRRRSRREAAAGARARSGGAARRA